MTVLLSGIVLAGCASSERRAAQERDRIFITYLPPAENDGRLRLAVKDLIDLKGVVTTAGSEFLAKHSPPAKEDAACLRIARERKVQIVGKTNLSELAVGVSGINIYFGTPRNTMSKRHLIPGGSSSGSAAAVQNGWADVAFGTDTAGSIRTPAAASGVAGLKTTFGLVSLKGVYPIAPTLLDTIGPMAKDVNGLVQGMDLLERGFAAKYRATAATKRKGGRVKVGRVYVEGTNAKIDEAVDRALAAAGFEVVVLDAAFHAAWEQASKDGRAVAAASAWEAGLKFQHEAQVQTRTKAVIAFGSFEYKLHMRDALRRRPAWQAALREVFKKVDFVALPTLQGVPPIMPPAGGTPAFEALVLLSQNTTPANLSGNPALAVPIPLQDRAVPLTSLQLIGPMRSEAALLRAGQLVEGVK